MLRFRFSARSDVGGVRELNEDSGLATNTLLIVADGLGGHAAGELASSTAISVINQLSINLEDSDKAAKSFRSATKDISRKLLAQADFHAERSGLGTTLSVVQMGALDEIFTFHIGDSRIYRLTDSGLERITRDHTYVQELIDGGEISESEARNHPKRSLLTQAIDGVTPAVGDFDCLKVRSGDKLLLCTDGLTAVLTDEEIHAALRDLEPAATVTSLVDTALDRGAPDNVTVIVAEVTDDKDQSNPEPVVVGAAAAASNRANLASLSFPRDQAPSLEDSKQGLAPLKESSNAVVKGASRNQIRLVIVTAFATLVFALIGVYASLLSTQVFVGVQDGQVALFRGIPQNILLLRLNRPIETSDLAILDLPPFEQQQIASGLAVNSERAGRDLIEQLRTRVITDQ